MPLLSGHANKEHYNPALVSLETMLRRCRGLASTIVCKESYHQQDTLSGDLSMSTWLKRIILAVQDDFGRAQVANDGMTATVLASY